MPVKPGYVMTIHRSQGQTFDSVVLDPSCKSSGQLYVALSRLRSISGLHLTKRISTRDLCLAPIVKEFYSHLGDSGYVPSWEKDISEQKGLVRRQDNVLKFPSVKMPGAPMRSVPEAPMRSVPEPEDAPEPEGTPSVREAARSEVPAAEQESASTAEEISVTETVMPKKNAAKDENTDVKKRRGRPVRYANSSKVCRIPVELIDEVRLMLQIVCPKGGMNVKELERFKSAIRELCEAE